MTADPLYSLIHSLSQAEKRYFKLSSLHSAMKEKHYIALYDFLEQQRVFDKEKLLLFASKNRIRNLASTKHFLSEQLLRAMRAYSEKGAREQLKHEAGSIAVLCNKGLYDSASRKLHSAIKQAKRYSFPDIIIDLLELERKIICYHQSDDFLRHSQRNYTEKQLFLKQLEYKSEISFLSDQLYVLSKRGESDLDQKLNKIFNSLKTFENIDLLFDGKRQWLTAMSLYHSIKRNFKKAATCHRQQVELWHSNPLRMKMDSKLYKRVLNNYASDIFDAQPDLFLEVLRQLKAIQDHSNETQAAEDFQNIMMLEFRYFLNRGEFSHCAGLIPNIEAGLEKFGTFMQLNRLSTFYYNMLVFYFVQGKYWEAKVWVEKILSIKETLYHFAVAKILEAIISLEINSNEMPDHIYINNLRLLKKKGFHKYYTYILRGIRKAARAGYDAKELNLQIRSMNKRKDFVGKEEILLWLQSKLTKKNIKEIFMQSRKSEVVEA